MKTVVRGLPEITDRVTPPPLCASEVAGVKLKTRRRNTGVLAGAPQTLQQKKKKIYKYIYGRVRHLQNKLLMCHAEIRATLSLSLVAAIQNH